MEWTDRLWNLLRRRRLEDEIAEEMASHLEEAGEHGRPPAEARRAFGNVLAYREQSRDLKLLPWLDALLSDAVFGWRQLRKRPAVSTAAILSLALAIGATTAAFRLVNAVLLRKLPVANPERLFVAAATFVDQDGHPDYRDDFDYPTYRSYRDAVADRADLMVVGSVFQQEMTMPGQVSDERVYQQYVSGNLFPVFRLRPAAGRLIAPDDDRSTSNPVAVLSYEFWTRRFARDPRVVGAALRVNGAAFTVIGVAPAGFTGTEPGAATDVFVPATRNTEALDAAGWSWFRLWVLPRPGFPAEQVRQPIQALFERSRREIAQGYPAGTPPPVFDAILKQKLLLLPAAQGASDVQKKYRRPLLILSVLVALLLLMACANVGNLLTAQAAARGREMALRVSIGAGRWRLFQLVLVEGLVLAAIASALGTLFASWSAPLVVSMLQMPENPVRLVLDSGWLDWAFAAGLALAVTLLFGLGPALRTSNVQPMSALRGGEDPHARRRLMSALLAAQMAFCILVQFVAGLFVSTFHRVTTRPLGVDVHRLLVMKTESAESQPLERWMAAADRIGAVTGLESAALTAFPFLSGNRWTMDVRLPGRAASASAPNINAVSPRYFSTMGIDLIGGRDFRTGDLPPQLNGANQPLAGAGIVNEAFARTYFDGANPVGRSIFLLGRGNIPAVMQIVGYVRDAVYADVHEPMRPTVYLPASGKRVWTFVVRMSSDARPSMPRLRAALPHSPAGLGRLRIEPETDYVRLQTLRERVLATLSMFFAVVALLLAAIGLYGVLNYSVTWRRREIGIRVALGARPTQIVWRTLSGFTGSMLAGLAIGLAGGIACGRFVESLLYEIKATDVSAVGTPLAVLLCVALGAAIPPAIRATRIDPARTLREE